jgi:hypothetical protein
MGKACWAPISARLASGGNARCAHADVVAIKKVNKSRNLRISTR